MFNDDIREAIFLFAMVCGVAITTGVTFYAIFDNTDAASAVGVVCGVLSLVTYERCSDD